MIENSGVWSIGPFAVLVGRLKHLVIGFGLPAADAEDIIQESLLALMLTRNSRIRRLTEDEMQAWLCRVARNKAIDHLRWLARRRIQSINTECLFDAPGYYDGETVAGSLPLSAAIQDALNDLTPTSREIVRLHAIDNFSYAHVSELIGLPVDRIRARYSWAIKKLRNRLRVDSQCVHDRG